MVFLNQKKKGKSYQKQRIVAIVRQKSKKNIPQVEGTIDYKNIILLRKFITTEGKILSRRINGLSAKQQRYIAKAIKKGRIIGLLPFINHSQPSRI